MFNEVPGVDWLFWWQIVAVMAIFVFGFLGGSILLRVGVKHLAKGSRSELTPCAVTWLKVGVVTLALGLIPYLGWIGSIFYSWRIISKNHQISYGKGALAWLPTLPAVAITVVLFVATVSTCFTHAHELAYRAGCAFNLSNVAHYLALYADANHGQLPPDMATLEKSNKMPHGYLECPSDCSGGPESTSYFYHIPDNESPKAVIACDLDGNHHNLHNVLLRDGTVTHVRDGEFQELLARPENKDFAAAFAAAERALPPVQSGR